MFNNNDTKNDTMTTLVITATDLTNNTERTIVLKASNAFMLAHKYIKEIKSLYVEQWRMYRFGFESGNKGLNSGAYLCETMEEISGLDLA